MFKHLYDVFSHWYHGGQIYFYSDPHFADKDSQCFRTNYIGDDAQVDRINSRVSDRDTIVILGDIGDRRFLSKIRGYKVLVLGNHDAGESIYRLYADEVYKGILTISDKIVLSHEPIALPFMFNIHGHEHNHNSSFSDALHLNVCAEHLDYFPVSLKSIINQGKLAVIPSIHRITIDAAIAANKMRIREELT